jgi:hypothetical protein
MILEMKRRGHPESAIRQVVYDNPLAFIRQAKRWRDWEGDEPANAHEGPAIGRIVIRAD